MALAALVALATGCSSPKKKTEATPVDAGAPLSTYLFAGADTPRSVHWTAAGDVVGMSATALWRLPGGALGEGATLEETKGNVIDVLEGDRWLVGGDGFVSLRDPGTLAEKSRWPTDGVVDRIVLSQNGQVALVHACATACAITRLDLQSDAHPVLGRGSGETMALTPDGKLAVLAPQGQLVVLAGTDPTPLYELAVDYAQATVVFPPDGAILFAVDHRVGRFDPATKKAKVERLAGSADEQLVNAADVAQSRIVSSSTYSGTDVQIYDGTSVRHVKVEDPGCGAARPSLDDPAQLECGTYGTRVDATGTILRQPLGQTLRRSEHGALRFMSSGCELVERPSGRILGVGTRALCRATFSPDGTRIAWLDDDGVVRVDALADIALPEPPTATGDTQVRSAAGVFAATFEDLVTFGGERGFETHPLGPNKRLSAFGPLGAFRTEFGRIVGIDLVGKTQLRAVDPAFGESNGNGTSHLFASGTSVVVGAYGHEKKTAVCRLGAQCTEIEIAPATEVVAYDAPWIVTATGEEPDAPQQVVYYLRHESGLEPPRRVIVGHQCTPPLLTEHGDKLACPSGDRLLWFDTKSGNALGEPLPLHLETPPAPNEAVDLPNQTRRYYRGSHGPDLFGLENGTLLVRTSSWLERAVHVEARPLPTAPSDAGAPEQAPRSVTVLTPTFAITRTAEGKIRVGGDASRAERLLACRQEKRLLPYAACRPPG